MQSHLVINVSNVLLLLLGLPIWYYTTAVHRAPLPAEEMRSAAVRAARPVVTLSTNFPVDWKRLSSPHYPVLFAPAAPNAVAKYSLSLVCDRPANQIVFEGGNSISFHHVDCSEFDPVYVIVATLLPRKESNLRVFKYARKLHATFSLLIADPDHLAVSWDIDSALASYMRPFVSRVSAVTNISLSSQVSLYASLPITPTKHILDNGAVEFTLNPSQLPHFINSAEWNLDSGVKSSPPISFVLYVPPASQSPLYILDEHGKKLPSNGFLIPRWGGIIIANPQSEHLSVHDLKPFMRVYLSQLRDLLGIKENWNRDFKRIKYDLVNKDSRSGIHSLEYDMWIRNLIAENLENSGKTLVSLITLIDEIDGMSVKENIRDLVSTSLSAMQEAAKAIDRMDYDKALGSSIVAVTSAEQAFFDDSLVSLLYFPTEHKYAVYMPFFVPTLVPILSFFRKSLRRR